MSTKDQAAKPEQKPASIFGSGGLADFKPVPQKPRSDAERNEEKKVLKDLGEQGGFTSREPKKRKKSTRTETLSIRLSGDEKDSFQRTAFENKLTAGDLLMEALAAYEERKKG